MVTSAAVLRLAVQPALRAVGPGLRDQAAHSVHVLDHGAGVEAAAGHHLHRLGGQLGELVGHLPEQVLVALAISLPEARVQPHGAIEVGHHLVLRVLARRPSCPTRTTR
jgi:hypothetical protein